MRITRLDSSHAVDYRAIMLDAYADDGEAFTATVAEREPLPMEFWEARASDDPDADQMVLGAFVDDRLVGVAGLRFEQRPRTRHKATLFGMRVVPELRGQGIARALTEAVLEHAVSTPDVRIVQLTVSESNDAAIRLYESCGFAPFGTEPFAIKVGERFVSKVHMWCEVGEGAA